jgi:hypothetical protein
MNEHEANEERIAVLGGSLNDAMLDAISTLPVADRAEAYVTLRDAMAHAPVFYVVGDQ